MLHLFCRMQLAVFSHHLFGGLFCNQLTVEETNYLKWEDHQLSSGYGGAMKGAFGGSIFPTNIPYEMGSRLELLRVSQPSSCQ